MVCYSFADPASRRNIVDALHGALQKCGSGSVGINYTGGTKAMSVHAFEEIRQNNARPDAVITYLDARTLTMRRVDDKAPSASEDVQFAVQPTLETLIDLHNIPIKKGQLKTETYCQTFNQDMAQAYANPDVAMAYEAWCQRYIRNFAKSNAQSALDDALRKLDQASSPEQRRMVLGMEVRAISAIHGVGRAEKQSQLPQRLIPFPQESVLRSVADAMREMMAVTGDTFDPEEVAQSRRTPFTRPKDIIRHLDGAWVEHLAMSAFGSLAEAHGLHGLCMTINTDEQAGVYNFEFDVVAMQGYRLHAVSCTRSADKPLCKGKVFEARLRASQLGGDEARVALVCAYPEPGKLQDQVQRWWSQTDTQFQVYGTRDLAHLTDCFDDWLKERSNA